MRHTSRARAWGAVLAAAAALGAAAPAAATPPGANGDIAFNTGADGFDPGLTSQIFRVHPDGSGLAQLTHVAEGAHAIRPDFSPDGTRIVYATDESGQWRIWVMDADGSNQHRLVNGNRGFDDLEASWTPDGGAVVFTRCSRGFGFCALDRAGAGGGRAAELISGNSHIGNPRVSPDGSTIAFDSTRGGFRSAIWTMPANGGKARRLTRPELEAFAPDWSPDGGSILFTDRCCLPFSNVWTMRPNGRAQHQITQFPFGEGEGFFARYSPDGTHIVFDHDQGPDDFQPQLFTMAVDGTDLELLATLDSVPFFPTWGPA